jgi:hypothetical protein
MLTKEIIKLGILQNNMMELLLELNYGHVMVVTFMIQIIV